MNKLEQILIDFNGFTDGHRMILVAHRGKDGGTNKEKSHKRFLTHGEEDFIKKLTEALEYQRQSKDPVRIYSCVNSRDINKAIRLFKQRQLDADYFDEVSKTAFYEDLQNRWISCVMNPSCRAETSFLIDIDADDIYNVDQVVEKLAKITRNFKTYKTKNGWHIITTPFNPALLPGVEIKKDGLLLLSF